MAFYKIGSGKAPSVNKRGGVGRVYLLRVTLANGTVVWKIGMCHSSRSTDRMLEVLKSFHSIYRYVPMCELRRDREYVVPLLIEKHLHELLDDLKYKFDKKFDGSTEFFSGLDEDMLLDYIDVLTEADLLKGRIDMKIEDYNAICALGKAKVDEEDVVPF